MPLFFPGKRVPRNAFLIKIIKVGNYQSIYDIITSLFYLMLRVQAFETHAGAKQCYKCQRYGHSSAFCHYLSRCVRCGEGHCKDSCPWDCNASATCRNCGDHHTASSKAFKDYAVALKRLLRSSQQLAPAPTHRPLQPASAASATLTLAAASACAPASARPGPAGALSYAVAAASQPAAQSSAQEPKPAALKEKVKTSTPASKQQKPAAPRPPSTPTVQGPRQPKKKAPA